MGVTPLPSGPNPPRSRVSGLATLVFLNVGLFFLLFILVEGALSTLLVSWDVLSQRVTPERRHTRYDPELGWVGIANAHFPNLYGPGVYLRTNSQGFRGSREFTEAVPPGKRRVICSGDSVTFGYGVGDDDSWCRLLESLDERFETVNMGLPGYGVDQAYLSYKRDAARLRHHVHLLAPITADFRRMQSRTYGPYGRPLLALEGGELVLRNVPVPIRSYLLPWLAENLHHLRSLRTVQALQRVSRPLTAPRSTPGGLSADGRNERTAQILFKLLEDLNRVNEVRSSKLVLVYLPTLNDRGPDTVFWTGVLERQSKALGIPFVNLTEEFDRLSDEEAAKFYRPGDLGHFSATGNRHVATLIYQRLKGIPEVSRILFTDDRR